MEPEELILEFGLDVLKGAAVSEIMDLFSGGSKPIDFDKLLKDFSDMVKKIVNQEILSEYTNFLNTLLTDFKDDYVNIDTDKAKIKFINDRYEGLRIVINFLLLNQKPSDDDKYPAITDTIQGLNHAIMGINLHNYMMKELSNMDDSERWLNILKEHLNDWYPVVRKILTDNHLPILIQDIDFLKKRCRKISQGYDGNGYDFRKRVCDMFHD